MRATVLLTLVTGAGVVISVQRQSPVAQAQATGTPNPEMSDSCGTDVVLVLDASGSISSAGAVDDVRDAGTAFLRALADTGSTARILQFASLSEELAPRTEVTVASLAAGGTLAEAMNDYYDPIPQRPPAVNIYTYYSTSGNPQSQSSWRAANTST